MKLKALFIFGFCVLSLPIASQVRDRTELFKLNHDQVELKWEGKAGRTYFIQWSGVYL